MTPLPTARLELRGWKRFVRWACATFLLEHEPRLEVRCAHCGHVRDDSPSKPSHTHWECIEERETGCGKTYVSWS